MTDPSFKSTNHLLSWVLTTMTCSLAQWSFLLVTEAGTSISLIVTSTSTTQTPYSRGSFWDQHPKKKKKASTAQSFLHSISETRLSGFGFQSSLCFYTIFFLSIIFYLSCLMDNPKLIYLFFSEVDTHWKTLEQGHFALLQSPTRSSVKALSKILPCQTEYFYWLCLRLNADLGSSLNPNGSAAIKHSTPELSLVTLMGFQIAALHWKFLHPITTSQRPPIS